MELGFVGSPNGTPVLQDLCDRELAAIDRNGLIGRIEKDGQGDRGCRSPVKECFLEFVDETCLLYTSDAADE